MSSRDDKIRLLLALEERKRRQRLAPLSRWGEFAEKKHPKQDRAIELTKQKRVTIFGGGNRSGKSTVLAAMIVCAVYGYYIWEVPDLQMTEDGDYPDRDLVNMGHWLYNAEGLPLRDRRTILVVTGLSMARGVANILWPKIEGFLPPAVLSSQRIRVVRGAGGVPLEIHFPNGSKILFGSAEQAVSMFEGIDCDIAFCDEPPPRAIFPGIWRGLTDHMGRLMFAMTPVGNNAPFVHEHFIADEERASQTGFVQASIWDNERNLGRRAINEFLTGGGFTSEERQARESGAWSFLTHRAFPGFDPAAHVIAPFEIPPSWVRGLSIDPAHRRPFALVWIAFEPRHDGRIVVYREWPDEPHHLMRSSDLTPRDYATVIRNLEGGEKMDFRCLDPRFGKQKPREHGEVRTSPQEKFAAVGLYFDCQLEGAETEETGIQLIRSLLRWDRNASLSPLNRPRLQVFNTCQNTINALALRNFVPPQAKDPQVLPEKLLEAYKDFCDALRYGLLYDRPASRNIQTDGYIPLRELEEANEEAYF